MKTSHRLWAAIGAAIVALPLHANPMRIDGIPALEGISASGITPMVIQERLDIRLLADQRPVTISPWPRILPQRFVSQDIGAGRRLLPGGPVDRVTFTAPADNHPWLIVETGTRRSAVLIGTWQLSSSGREWHITDGSARKTLKGNARQPAPVSVTVDGARWCIYLLESTFDEKKPDIAAEREPQIAWAAVRMGRKHCPAQR